MVRPASSRSNSQKALTSAIYSRASLPANFTSGDGETQGSFRHSPNSEDANVPTFLGRTKSQFLEDSIMLPAGLELYDIYRPSRVLKDPAAELQATMLLSTSGLSEDLSCPICMGTYQRVMVVKDCLHRFCSECIEKWLRSGHQDCPQCRNRIPSRRSLRPDPIFERMIRRLFPNVKEFEARNDSLVAEANKRKNSCSSQVPTTNSSSVRNLIDNKSSGTRIQFAPRRRGRPPNSARNLAIDVYASSVQSPGRPSPTSSDTSGPKVDVICTPDVSVEALKDLPQKKLLIRQGTVLEALAKYLIGRARLTWCPSILRFYTKYQKDISCTTTIGELKSQFPAEPILLFFTIVETSGTKVEERCDNI